MFTARYVLPTQCICVLCGSEKKQRLFHCTALTGWFYNRDELCLLRGTFWIFVCNSDQFSSLQGYCHQSGQFIVNRELEALDRVLTDFYLLHTITCFKMQFLRKMWPIQLAFLLFTVYRIFLSSLTVCYTSLLHTRSVQLMFSILLQNHTAKLSKYFWSTSSTSKFQPHTMLCSKCSTLLVSSSNLSPVCWLKESSSCWMLLLPRQSWTVSRVHLASFVIMLPKWLKFSTFSSCFWSKYMTTYFKKATFIYRTKHAPKTSPAFNMHSLRMGCLCEGWRNERFIHRAKCVTIRVQFVCLGAPHKTLHNQEPVYTPLSLST